MTKAEILKWLLFVGSSPVTYQEVLERYPQREIKDKFWQREKFSMMFSGWENEGFVVGNKVEVYKKDDLLGWVVEYSLTDKAKDRLNGKRIKKTGWEGAIAKYRRRKL